MGERGDAPIPPAPTGPWVDNHCHLGVGARGGEAPPADEVVDRARAHGVVAFITVGTDASSSAECIARADSTEGVWATAGVHPHDATEGTAALRDVVAGSLGGGSLVAIGECGLDYHYDHSPRDVQRGVFAEQVQMAHELDLPLVIHTRDAWDDTFAVLDDLGTPRRTVFHCFTGGPADAEGCRSRGALLSVSGIVTFPSATELRDAVAATPLGSLMVETDSPYLAPVPHRGSANEPAWVGLVGAEVARLHGVDVAEVAATTTATASAFYGLGL
jgi:TatD DNase family protein